MFGRSFVVLTGDRTKLLACYPFRQIGVAVFTTASTRPLCALTPIGAGQWAPSAFLSAFRRLPPFGGMELLVRHFAFSAWPRHGRGGAGLRRWWLMPQGIGLLSLNPYRGTNGTLGEWAFHHTSIFLYAVCPGLMGRYQAPGRPTLSIPVSFSLRQKLLVRLNSADLWAFIFRRESPTWGKPPPLGLSGR